MPNVHATRRTFFNAIRATVSMGDGALVPPPSPPSVPAKPQHLKGPGVTSTNTLNSNILTSQAIGNAIDKARSSEATLLSGKQKAGLERQAAFHRLIKKSERPDPEPENNPRIFTNIKSSLNLVILLTLQDPDHASDVTDMEGYDRATKGILLAGPPVYKNLFEYGNALKADLKAYIDRYGLDALNLSGNEKEYITDLMALAYPKPSLAARAVSGIASLPGTLIGGALGTPKAIGKTLFEPFQNIYRAVTTPNDPKGPLADMDPLRKASPYGMFIFNAFPALRKTWYGRLAGGIVSLVLLPVDLAVGLVFNTMRAFGMGGATLDKWERRIHKVASGIFLAAVIVGSILTGVGAIPGVAAAIPALGAMAPAIGSFFTSIGPALASIGPALASVGPALTSFFAAGGPFLTFFSAAGPVATFFAPVTTSLAAVGPGAAATFTALTVATGGGALGVVAAAAITLVAAVVTVGVVYGIGKLATAAFKGIKAFFKPKASDAALEQDTKLSSNIVAGPNTVINPKTVPSPVISGPTIATAPVVNNNNNNNNNNTNPTQSTTPYVSPPPPPASIIPVNLYQNNAAPPPTSNSGAAPLAPTTSSSSIVAPISNANTTTPPTFQTPQHQDEQSQGGKKSTDILQQDLIDKTTNTGPAAGNKNDLN